MIARPEIRGNRENNLTVTLLNHDDYISRHNIINMILHRNLRKKIVINIILESKKSEWKRLFWCSTCHHDLSSLR